MNKFFHVFYLISTCVMQIIGAIILAFLALAIPITVTIVGMYVVAKLFGD